MKRRDLLRVFGVTAAAVPVAGGAGGVEVIEDKAVQPHPAPALSWGRAVQ